MKRLAKNALDILNKKLEAKEIHYTEEYTPLAEALSQLEAYEYLDKTPSELFCMLHNIKSNKK